MPKPNDTEIVGQSAQGIAALLLGAGVVVGMGFGAGTGAIEGMILGGRDRSLGSRAARGALAGALFVPAGMVVQSITNAWLPTPEPGFLLRNVMWNVAQHATVARAAGGSLLFGAIVGAAIGTVRELL